MGGWRAVDLDGTLAHYDDDGWKSPGHIGEPIPLMVERVKRWIALGDDVRIFTARCGHPEAIKPIEEWCLRHLGKVLPITATKDFEMIDLWDDRVVQVHRNTGLLAGFDHYQATALKTAVYPDIGNNITYPALGLGGEAGEYLNKVKKIYRDDMLTLNEDRRVALIDELGDVLWYVAICAYELKASLSTIAQKNLIKLAIRRANGTIKGSGDNR